MSNLSTPVKHIYFVRHGQSEGNVEGVMQDGDSPLTGIGREQAYALAERILTFPLEALLSSALRRGKETADILSERTGKKVEYYGLLNERRKPVAIAGKPMTNKRAVRSWERWNESLFVSGQREEDGENFDDIKARAIEALAMLAKRPESHIVVVTHDFFLRMLVASVVFGESLTGDEFRKIATTFTMQNGGITIFRHVAEEEHPWNVWVWNDHAHLKGNVGEVRVATSPEDMTTGQSR